MVIVTSFIDFGFICFLYNFIYTNRSILKSLLPEKLQPNCFLQCCVYLEADQGLSCAALRKADKIPLAVLQQDDTEVTSILFGFRSLSGCESGVGSVRCNRGFTSLE